jgi:uncharacterized membrane protein YphA (DoxX/SURF4 family)
MDYTEGLSKYAPVVIRVGVALVVLWFGWSQVTNPAQWLGVLPEWTKSLPVGQINLIYLNGWTELFLGLLLLVGFYTRFVALIVALHLLNITITVGYNAIGVRDFGLTLAAVSIFLKGHDMWSVDHIFEKMDTHAML